MTETGGQDFYPVRKLRTILSGLTLAVISDVSVAYKVVLSILVLGVSFVFRSWIDFSVILLATGLMLVAELLNSAIEDLSDFVQDQQDPRIRVIKDIGSAAAGTSILVWAVVLVIEVVHLLGLFR
ncbi:MAG: diacylglycerol kinase [Desulfomonilia bacterium]|uniref:Diacylglycerol kinase n=1 Tax=anaerobic digester metagenome TaxID=1263854 RepID=A0A485M057_9ZZZZ|nr:diacylglycerol kinase [Pseudomonadota bacterium]HON38018.1 diacylglycerol kinase [Deltaproteobacteria bacterium]HRS55035.1 diacylglycerol kinase [Desulfomonilia bacterium]HPD20752.1 diacylglycerol kinase [Deltaproteobacteria bacterium]HPX18552.1 diacylglycerol kinase [Deltaproteobacteria bacterium]